MSFQVLVGRCGNTSRGKPGQRWGSAAGYSLRTCTVSASGARACWTTGIIRTIPLALLIEFRCINSPEANALTAEVEAVDRLARSIRQLIETVEELGRCKIGLRSLTEAIDTTTPGGRLV